MSYGFVRHLTPFALALAALACSSDDSDGDRALEETGGTGGSGNGTAGSSVIPVGTGGSDASGGTDPGTGGTAGGSSTPTVDDLRDQACAGWSLEPELIPSVLQLVVDTSLSMRDSTPATDGQTKWQVTGLALAEAIDALPASLAMGMLFYPNRSTMGSEVELDPSECVNLDAMIPIDLLGDIGSQHRARLQAGIGDAEPNGSTPTHDAYHHGLENGLLTTRFTGQRFMLLITDGTPTLAQNCYGRGTPQFASPTDPIAEEIASAATRGVRTFIIGSPGSEISANGGDARPWMSNAVLAGGTAREGCHIDGPDFCHVDLTQSSDFSSSLRASLAEIAGLITTCRFEIPAPPAGEELDLSLVNVIFTPGGSAGEQLLGRDDSAECSAGFRVENNEVVLCPETCQTLQADNTSKVELLFGCASVVPVK